MTRNEYLDSTVLTDSKTGAKVTMRDFYGSLGIEFDEEGHVKKAGLSGGSDDHPRRLSGKAAMMHSRREVEELADWCIGEEDDPGVRGGRRFVYLVPVEVRARAERLGMRGYGE